MRKLQAEHAAWLAKKYPGMLPEIPAMGCLEEAGELVHAVLKSEQVRLWGEDARHKVAALRAKLADAVGDCALYACSLCNANGWDFEELWNEAEPEDAVHVVEFAQSAVDVARDPDYEECLVTYLRRLRGLAHQCGLDAEMVVRSTWETVRCR